ncbi:MAG: hypothetical protein ACRCUY_10425 [Thermoguttaceae bacterium]
MSGRCGLFCFNRLGNSDHSAIVGHLSSKSSGVVDFMEAYNTKAYDMKAY